MPVVSVNRDRLFEALDQVYSEWSPSMRCSAKQGSASTALATRVASSSLCSR